MFRLEKIFYFSICLLFFLVSPILLHSFTWAFKVFILLSRRTRERVAKWVPQTGGYWPIEQLQHFWSCPGVRDAGFPGLGTWQKGSQDALRCVCLSCSVAWFLSTPCPCATQTPNHLPPPTPLWPPHPLGCFMHELLSWLLLFGIRCLIEHMALVCGINFMPLHFVGHLFFSTFFLKL